MKRLTNTALAGERDRLKIAARVIASGHVGVTHAELRAYVDRCEWTVGRHLRALAARELIEKTSNGGGCRWGAPGIRAAHESAKAPKPERQRKVRDRTTANEWANAEPVRRIVPALDAPRINVARPASIFALGTSL